MQFSTMSRLLMFGLLVTGTSALMAKSSTSLHTQQKDKLLTSMLKASVLASNASESRHVRAMAHGAFQIQFWDHPHAEPYRLRTPLIMLAFAMIVLLVTLATCIFFFCEIDPSEKREQRSGNPKPKVEIRSTLPPVPIRPTPVSIRPMPAAYNASHAMPKSEPTTLPTMLRPFVTSPAEVSPSRTNSLPPMYSSQTHFGSARLTSSGVLGSSFKPAMMAAAPVTQIYTMPATAQSSMGYAPPAVKAGPAVPSNGATYWQISTPSNSISLGTSNGIPLGTSNSISLGTPVASYAPSDPTSPFPQSSTLSASRARSAGPSIGSKYLGTF